MTTLSHPTVNHSARRGASVVAVCVHWTGGTYASAVDWCRRREASVSYHEIIAPDGTLATLVAPERSAWAVGKSRAPAPWEGASGNAMTYNIALAGGPRTPPTEAQRLVLLQRIVLAFATFGWSLKDSYRITGHHQWAWPRGRKVDPVGSGWLDLNALRAQVST